MLSYKRFGYVFVLEWVNSEFFQENQWVFKVWPTAIFLLSSLRKFPASSGK